MPPQLRSWGHNNLEMPAWTVVFSQTACSKEGYRQNKTAQTELKSGIQQSTLDIFVL